MPLFEYECITCRKDVDDSLKSIQKKANSKIVSELVKKYDYINHIVVYDTEKEDILGEHGKRDKDGVDLDFYLNDGTILVFLNVPEHYRFSELIYEDKDEKKVKCPYCDTKKVEKVVSSFAFTSDLSTNMPKPDLSNLPPEVAARTRLGEYIEEKDRPKKNR